MYKAQRHGAFHLQLIINFSCIGCPNRIIVPYTFLSFHLEPMDCKYYHIHVPDTDNYCSGELESMQQGMGNPPLSFGSFNS